MSAVELVEAVFLVFAAAVVLLCSIGLWAMDDVYGRLHCLGPATVLASLAVAVAVLLRHSSAQAVIKVLLVAIVILVVNPIIASATARAAWTRDSSNDEAGDDGTGETL